MSYSIKDVAKAAGVSVATVSRVLNNKDKVKDKTREKILSTVEKMGYALNFSAKALRENKTNLIGVVVRDISTAFFSEMIKGIENKATENNYRLIVCDSQGNKDREMDYLRLLYEKSVSGMIIITPTDYENLKKVKEDNHSIVVFGIDMEDMNVPSIVIDNVSGAYNAVKHLYLHGYRRIAFIGGFGFENDVNNAERLSGYKKALEDFRLQVKDDYIANGHYENFGGGNAFEKLMKLPEPPDAIFCTNDEMAFGVIRAAKKLNIKIPDQVGLIGFDNIQACQYSSPTLTSINQGAYNVGTLLCDKIILLLNDNILANKTLVLKPELITRESCGC